jgi:hypothetical protein
MDQLLECHNPPKLAQREINNMNQPIAIKEN